MKKVIAVLLAVAVTGCSGIEVGGKAWIARVDQHSESTVTNRQPLPLKCYFVSCEQVTASEGAVSGS